MKKPGLGNLYRSWNRFLDWWRNGHWETSAWNTSDLRLGMIWYNWIRQPKSKTRSYQLTSSLQGWDKRFRQQWIFSASSSASIDEKERILCQDADRVGPGIQIGPDRVSLVTGKTDAVPLKRDRVEFTVAVMTLQSGAERIFWAIMWRTTGHCGSQGSIGERVRYRHVEPGSAVCLDGDISDSLGFSIFIGDLSGEVLRSLLNRWLVHSGWGVCGTSPRVVV